MKQLSLSWVAILLMAIMSCRQEGKSSEGTSAEQALQFITLCQERTLQYEIAGEYADEKPYYSNAQVDLIWPQLIAGDTELADLQQAMLQTFFADSVSATLDEAVERILSTPLDVVAAECSNIEVVDSADADWTHMSASSLTVQLLRADSRLIVFQGKVYDYFAGAAHPMTACLYVNYDVKRHRVIRLDDVITDRDALARLLSRIYTDERCASSTHGFNTFESDGGYDIPATDNFCITPEGLSFVYQPYEIAAYAEGVQTIRVSFYELLDAHILTARFQDVEF